MIFANGPHCRLGAPPAETVVEISVRAARTRSPSSITAGAKANVPANVADATALTRSVSLSTGSP
jgi:hypothetical protein